MWLSNFKCLMTKHVTFDTKSVSTCLFLFCCCYCLFVCLFFGLDATNSIWMFEFFDFKTSENFEVKVNLIFCLGCCRNQHISRRLCSHREPEVQRNITGFQSGWNSRQGLLSQFFSNIGLATINEVLSEKGTHS